MKAVVAVRILRQWHWMRKVYYNIHVALEVVNSNNSYIISNQPQYTNDDAMYHNSTTRLTTTPVVAVQTRLKGSLSRSSLWNCTNQDDDTNNINNHDRIIMSPYTVTTPNASHTFLMQYPRAMAALTTNATMDTEMEENEEEEEEISSLSLMMKDRFRSNMGHDVRNDQDDRINDDDDDDYDDETSNEFEHSRVILFPESDDSNKGDEEIHDDSYFYDDDNDDDDVVDDEEEDDSPY